MLWCVPLARKVIYSFIDTFPPHFLDSSVCCSGFVLVYIPSFPFLLCWLLRDLSHIGTILMYFIHLGFLLLQPISSCLFAVEDVILMFSLYLSLSPESRLSRPVI